MVLMVSTGCPTGAFGVCFVSLVASLWPLGSSFFFTFWATAVAAAEGSLQGTAIAAAVVRFLPFDKPLLSLILSLTLLLLLLLILLQLLLVLLLTLLDMLPEVVVLLALLLLSLIALLASLLLLLLFPPNGAADLFSFCFPFSAGAIWGCCPLDTMFTFHALRLLNTFCCSRRFRLGELIRWLFLRLVLFSVEMAVDPFTLDGTVLIRPDDTTVGVGVTTATTGGAFWLSCFLMPFTCSPNPF